MTDFLIVSNMVQKVIRSSTQLKVFVRSIIKKLAIVKLKYNKVYLKFSFLITR